MPPEQRNGVCPACGQPRALHTLGPPTPPQIKGHLGATEDRPGSCLVEGVGRVEHTPAREQLSEVDRLRDLVGSMWLYMRGRGEVHLTTEQRELLYDVLDAGRESGEPPMQRWWRGPLDVEWPRS